MAIDNLALLMIRRHNNVGKKNQSAIIVSWEYMQNKLLLLSLPDIQISMIRCMGGQVPYEK